MKLLVLLVLSTFCSQLAAETITATQPAIGSASTPVVRKAAPAEYQGQSAALKSGSGAPEAAAQSTVRVLLVPEKETTISSTISARIKTINGELGQSFRTGDILVAFDCEEANARVEMSKAELFGAIEQHEAKVKMQGLEQASDVEVALAASSSNKAKAQLSLHKAQASQCQINAPWEGRVAKTTVKNHMTVTPGQPLMEIVKSGPLKLKLNAPSKLINTLKSGATFTVKIDETGLTYPAVVVALNSRVDPVSQTIELEGQLTQPYSELLAGMSGEANFSER